MICRNVSGLRAPLATFAHFGKNISACRGSGAGIFMDGMDVMDGMDAFAWSRGLCRMCELCLRCAFSAVECWGGPFSRGDAPG